MTNAQKHRESVRTRNREIDLEISPTYGVIDITPVKLVPILRDSSKTNLPASKESLNDLTVYGTESRTIRNEKKEIYHESYAFLWTYLPVIPLGLNATGCFDYSGNTAPQATVC